jgi:hypothetical protein
MNVPSIPRPSTPVKIDLPNGKEITVFLWMNNSGKLEVDAPGFGVFEMEPKGLQEIATIVLEVTGGFSCRF